jgi:hypothetical protein
MTLEEITEKLNLLQSDPDMATKGAYSPTAVDYPQHQLPFVEVHLAYLRKNKHVNPEQYLSNLVIMIKQH